MPTTSHKWWTLIATGIGSLMITIDFTIVNIALANIQVDLNAKMSQLQWVMTAYGITFCAFLIAMGRFGDLKGHKKIILFGAIGFGLASLGAGLAQTPEQLILCRFVQGIAGAVGLPCGMAATVAAFPKEQQGRALGIYGSIVGIGLALGPVIGGLILSFASWRWIFYINVPIIIISVMLIIIFVHETKMRTDIKIDWLGVLFLVLSLGLFVYAVTEGPNRGWTSPFIIISFALAITSCIAFIRSERRTSNPLLPPHLFMNHGFLIGTIVYIVSISWSWTVIFFAPLYLQNVLQIPVALSGLIILPMTAMTVVAPPIAGHLYDKVGIKFTTLLLFFFLIVAFILQLFFNTNDNWILIITAFLIYGFAWGMGNGIGTPLALSELSNTADSGLVTGAVITILNIIGVIGLTVSGTLFHYVEKANIEQLQRVAFVHGYRSVIWLLLITTLICLLIVWRSLSVHSRKAR